MRRIFNATALMTLLICASCTFKNDMSYPPLQGQITAFAVEGQKSVTIDAEAQTVQFLLEETAEITNLKVTEFAISEKTTLDNAPGQYIDLSEPVDMLLKTYPGQEYPWVVSASQPIERYIRCSGLIDAVFDAQNRTALVYVLEKQPLEDIVIEDMKLGPETSVVVSTTGHDNADSGEVTHEVVFPMALDCTLARTFTILYKGVEYDWTVTFVQKAVQNEIRSVNAWTYHAEVKGEFNGEGTPYYEYRKASEQEWNRFDDVVVDGVGVYGDITGLEEATEYAVRLVSGDVVGDHPPAAHDRANTVAKGGGHPRPTSAWLFNTLMNKHADASDSYPLPAVLPREEKDSSSARMLSDILPAIMERCDFEQTYSDNWWEKLKHGCGG